VKKAKHVDASTLAALTAKVMRDDPALRERFRRALEISKPILDDLAGKGYEVQTLAQLRHLGRPWKTALPVLLNWLPLIKDLDIKEEIVRCLSVPWVGTKATNQLIKEFRNAPVGSSLAWAIGNALSVVDVKDFKEEIVQLCRDPHYGTARQMVVLGLGRFMDAEAEETALDLLADEEVKLHAIIALAKMHSQRALPKLEKLLVDKRSVIRKEARKAITRITRLRAQKG
jgi:HEAT repeats